MEQNDIQSSSCHPWQSRRPIVRHPGLGIGILFGTMFIGIVIVGIIQMIVGSTSPKAMRIITLAQDVIAFIVPAIIAAIAVTRRPADFLSLTVKPALKPTLLACIVLATAMPAIEYIGNLNAQLPLPEALQQYEQAAEESIDAIAGGSSIGSLILGVLLIGILAGFSEEIYFRGGMQNLFMSLRINKHIAIWIVAIIFSLMHFQFSGFVPRILLGAYFGYLIWWTGSVWVPIIAHALNNTIVVVVGWIYMQNAPEAANESISNASISTDWLTVTLSFIVTALGLYLLRRTSLKPPTR